MITSFISAVLSSSPVQGLNIAVEGDGYLRFVKNGKTVYSRKAELFTTPNGLSTEDGALLVPRIIALGALSEILIDLDGTIAARIGTSTRDLGHIYLANFKRSTKFTKIGNYLATTSKPKLSAPGIGTSGVMRSTTQAGFTVTSTELPFDLVISGEGFFKVLTPDGMIAYTREGRFHRDPTGLLVNQIGYPLVPQISIPEGSLQSSVGSDGIVEVVLQSSTIPTKIERIQIVKFAYPAFLKLAPGNVWIPTKSSGDPIEATPGVGETGYIYSGYILGSHSKWNETLSNGLTLSVNK